MIIYIVIQNQPPFLMESVWSTHELALAAIQFHAYAASLPPTRFSITKRELNTAYYNSRIND